LLLVSTTKSRQSSAGSTGSLYATDASAGSAVCVSSSAGCVDMAGGVQTEGAPAVYAAAGQGSGVVSARTRGANNKGPASDASSVNNAKLERLIRNVLQNVQSF